MNSQPLEQDVVFFSAYLALHGADLPFNIPRAPEAYAIQRGRSQRPDHLILVTEISIADDVALQVHTEFPSGMTVHELNDLARDFADSLQAFASDAEEVIEEVRRLRPIAEREFAKLPEDEGLRLVSVAPVLILADHYGAANVLTFQRLGSDARPQLETVEFSDDAELASMIETYRNDQRLLNARAREFAEHKAEGAIDVVLLEHLKAHDVDPFSIMESAHAAPARHWISTPAGDLLPFWKDGVFSSRFKLSDAVDWHGGVLTFAHDANMFEGDQAGRLVCDLYSHSYLDGDLRVLNGRGTKDKVNSIETELRYAYFDTGSKRIWREQKEA